MLDVTPRTNEQRENLGETERTSLAVVGLRERVIVEGAVEDELSIVDEAAESVVTLS